MSHISPVLWQFLVKWLTNFSLYPPEASKIAPADGCAVLLHGPGEPDRADDRHSARHQLLDHVQQEAPSGSGADRGLHDARSHVDHHSARPVPHHVCLGRAHLLPRLHAARQRHEHLRRRQAVDVEGRASRRTARNQLAACSHWPRRPAHHHLAGCLPQFFHSRIPREARSHPGPLHNRLV